jgi:hypothetical protein
LFGRSDQVVFRIVAYPSLRPRTKRTTGLYQRPYSADVTSPFRVAGTRIRVLKNGVAQAGAMVYRLPAGQAAGGAPYIGAGGQPRATRADGYLPGRGVLNTGDRLVALLPVNPGESTKYRRYITSAPVAAAGLNPFTVSQAGVQTLTVSPSNALILFDLKVSLEWNARSDTRFLSQLKTDLARTSDLLYAWSDGQAALGQVTIYHDKQNWDSADFQVYATNRLRPNAQQGGIVTANRVDPDRGTITYEPGQIRMGAVWNRNGDASGTLGEDWPRALGHELGHYALFLDETYLGLDANEQLISVEGCASPMSDPYREDYGKFRPDAGWLPSCALTLANQSTGRSEWATIKRLYDQSSSGFAFKMPASFNPASGPRVLPLAFTTIAEAAPTTATPPASAIFTLEQANGVRYLASVDARTYLFSAAGDRLTDLGNTDQTEVLARGARAGDRLCVFDLDRHYLGCETVQAGDTRLVLADLGAKPWQPQVLITPASPTSLDVVVGNLPAGLTLKTRVFPLKGAATTAATLSRVGADYRTTIATAAPVFAGYVQLWVEESGTRREAVTDFALGGNPAPPQKPPKKGKKAPALSPDGQVVLFGDNLDFPANTFFAIQSLTNLPVAAPPWTVPVGRGYRLIASPGAPNLSTISLNMGYLENDVTPGTEGGIGIYYLAEGGTKWERLDTRLDVGENETSTKARGPGSYVLMTSLEMGMGWNMLSYPWAETMGVEEGLAQINGAGAYTTVYGYDWRDSADPWKVYDVDAPAFVNDLTELRYGKGYWVNVVATQSTVSANLETIASTQPSLLVAPQRPATYYAELGALGGSVPAVGTPVQALIGGVLCAQTTTRLVDGQIVFAIDVPAAAVGPLAGCGQLGREVVVKVDAKTFKAIWIDGRPQRLGTSYVYMPLVRR